MSGKVNVLLGKVAKNIEGVSLNRLKKAYKTLNVTERTEILRNFRKSLNVTK